MMTKHILKIWGTLDIAYFAYYVVGNIVEGKVPFVTDISLVQPTVTSFGDYMPMVVVSLSVALMISLAASGYFLITGQAIGRWIVYGQFPFRMVLMVPSIFFLPWLFSPIEGNVNTIAAVIVLLAIELFKLFTISKAYKQHNKAPQKGRTTNRRAC